MDLTSVVKYEDMVCFQQRSAWVWGIKKTSRGFFGGDGGELCPFVVMIMIRNDIRRRLAPWGEIERDEDIMMDIMIYWRSYRAYAMPLDVS